MSKTQLQHIIVNELKIHIKTINDENYICLTDLAKFKSKNTRKVIQNWMRAKSTIDFLTTWETIFNPYFKGLGSEAFKNTNFLMSPVKWIQSTNAIGIISKRGRYGAGTYAHKDIAMEFLTWLSPTFKLYVIQEYQRLKELEKVSFSNEHEQLWYFNRMVAKRNYHLQTDAIEKHLVSQKNLTLYSQKNQYAIEADLINEVIFHSTAGEFKRQNPDLAKKGQNLRDIASLVELIVLANLEAFNSKLIEQGITRIERKNALIEEASRQLEVFNKQKNKKLS